MILEGPLRTFQRSRDPSVKERPGTYHSYAKLLRGRTHTHLQALPSLPEMALPPVDLNSPYPQQYVTQISGRRSDGSGYELPANYLTSSGYELPVNYSVGSGYEVPVSHSPDSDYEVPIGHIMQERIYEDIDEFLEDHDEVEEREIETVNI